MEDFDNKIDDVIKSHDIYYSTDTDRKPSKAILERYPHVVSSIKSLVHITFSNSKYYDKADKSNGIYDDHAGGYYRLPRCEFLLHRVKSIEDKIIEWYKKNHYSQGDSYSVSITKKGKWEVSYSNDYPMQHGDGKSKILTEDEFLEATK